MKIFCARERLKTMSVRFGEKKKTKKKMKIMKEELPPER